METVGISSFNIFKSFNQDFESNHAVWLLNKLNTDRLTTKESCDVKIVAGTKQFSAHKCILSAFSEFWRKMFTVKMKENYSSEAQINGVNGDIMNILLTYIYTGKVSLNDDNVYSLIESSHYMQLPFILDHCSTYLEKNLSEENCFDALNCAVKYDLVKITKISQKIIIKSLADGEILEKFMNLELKNVIDLINSSHKMISEETKFKAIIKWVNSDKEVRKENFYQLFTLLDLQNFSKEILQNFIATEELVAQSFECTKLVMNAAFNLPTAPILPESNNKDIQTEPEVLDVEVAASRIFDYLQSRNQYSPVENLLIIGSDAHHVAQFNINTKKWKARKKPSKCGLYSTACRTKNHVYVMGGGVTEKSKALDVVERFDLNEMNKGWEEVTSMMIGRKHAASSCIDDDIFVVGGLAHDSGWLSSGEFYDSERDVWYKIPDLIIRRQDHAMRCIGRQLYVIGGYTPSTRLSSMEMLDHRTNSWRNASSMSCARDDLASVELNGEIYAIGGDSGNNTLDTVEIYRPRANKWVSGSSLLHARKQHCACVVDGKIYVVGGCKNQGSICIAQNSIEMFDPAVGEWQLVTKLTRPRYDSSVVAF